MGNTNIFEVYEEYQAILSILAGKQYELGEDISFIDISLNKDFDLDLLKELECATKHFEINCNPFSDECEDIIIDIERGTKKLDDLDSISINIEKQYGIDEINNIQYLFFEKRAFFSSVNTISNNDLAVKINVGIMDIQSVQTELFNFVNINKNSDFSNFIEMPISQETANHIEFYLSNNRKNNHTPYYNPYSFLLTGNYVENNGEFVELIKNQFYTTMLQSLSDKVKDGNFIIRGDKSISITLDNSFSTTSYKYLVDVFSFLISHQKFTEKFIITKKVITLYINDQDTVSNFDAKLPDIWKTINHYYDHYIEDNLKEFFKTKDQLLKEAMNVSKVIYEQTDKIGSSIIASIISTIILLVTTLYRTLENLNIIYSSLFIIVFFIFSVVFYQLMKDSSKKRYELTKGQFDHFVKEIALIRSEEVEVIRDKYLNDPYKELTNTLNKLLYLFVIVNTFMIVSFLIYICIKYGYCFC